MSQPASAHCATFPPRQYAGWPSPRPPLRWSRPRPSAPQSRLRAGCGGLSRGVDDDLAYRDLGPDHTADRTRSPGGQRHRRRRSAAVGGPAVHRMAGCHQRCQVELRPVIAGRAHRVDTMDAGIVAEGRQAGRHAGRARRRELTGVGFTGSGCHPAIARAASRACSLSVMPGEPAVRVAAVSASETTNMTAKAASGSRSRTGPVRSMRKHYAIVAKHF
jgi:hypothetical protein